MFKTLPLTLFFVLLLLYGCATVYNPATGQKEIIFVTTPAEVALGNTISLQISNEFTFNKNQEKNDRLNRIGEKIANVSDRKDLTYKFYVIEDKALNAFTTPGGYVYVNSGVMDKSTDDELACVVGHEVGHVALRHIAKKLQAQLGYDILMNIAARKSGIEEIQTAASISYNLMMLGYSREDEVSSDKLGARYAYKAGFDPYAMISFLEKLKNESDENLGVVFLRSHPYVSQRIKILSKEIPLIIGAGNSIDTGAMPDKKKDIFLAEEGSAGETAKKIPSRLMCSKCRKIFSGKTKYCPYCGIKLE